MSKGKLLPPAELERLRRCKGFKLAANYAIIVDALFAHIDALTGGKDDAKQTPTHKATE